MQLASRIHAIARLAPLPPRRHLVARQPATFTRLYTHAHSHPPLVHPIAIEDTSTPVDMGQAGIWERIRESSTNVALAKLGYDMLLKRQRCSCSLVSS